MDVREKLVELLWEYDQMRMMRMSIEECADRLIPKGLTVRKYENDTKCSDFAICLDENKKEKTERIVDLMTSFYGVDPGYYGVEAYPLASHLIAHGVTVQEGKPLEAFLHLIDAYKGLKAKYLVFKADTGEKVENCFILRPDKDFAAVEALRAYASATDNETLAEDIYNWVGKGEPVQEWISVKDKLPEDGEIVLVCGIRGGVYTAVLNKLGQYKGWHKLNSKSHYCNPTHWMPLPQPPKGE